MRKTLVILSSLALAVLWSIPASAQYFGRNKPRYEDFDFNPLFSAGASLRINVFGALILEPYYAFPLLKETKGTFGLNIVPGW